jgi:hypothetical protein
MCSENRAAAAVAPFKRERAADGREPLETCNNRGERGEGRLNRVAQRPRERLEKRGLDRRPRFTGLATDIVGSVASNDFAENRRDDQAIDALIERDQKPRLGIDARVDRGCQAGAVSDRPKQRRCASRVNRGAGRARNERRQAQRRVDREPIEGVAETRHPFEGKARVFEHRALQLARAVLEFMRFAVDSHAASLIAASPPPEVVSFSTTSIVGRSLEGIVLRPNSTAT